MSKSVTVIHGQVWTQRSVTWNGNVAGGNVVSASRSEHDPSAGDGPDHARNDEWDSIQEGRNFTRRVKTS
jgi:hypothetical protein